MNCDNIVTQDIQLSEEFAPAGTHPVYVSKGGALRPRVAFRTRMGAKPSTKTGEVRGEIYLLQIEVG